MRVQILTLMNFLCVVVVSTQAITALACPWCGGVNRRSYEVEEAKPEDRPKEKFHVLLSDPVEGKSYEKYFDAGGFETDTVAGYLCKLDTVALSKGTGYKLTSTCRGANAASLDLSIECDGTFSEEVKHAKNKFGMAIFALTLTCNS